MVHFAGGIPFFHVSILLLPPVAPSRAETPLAIEVTSKCGLTLKAYVSDLSLENE
jgi:hypothetical protein